FRCLRSTSNPPAAIRSSPSSPLSPIPASRSPNQTGFIAGDQSWSGRWTGSLQIVNSGVKRLGQHEILDLVGAAGTLRSYRHAARDSGPEYLWKSTQTG